MPWICYSDSTAARFAFIGTVCLRFTFYKVYSTAICAEPTVLAASFTHISLTERWHFTTFALYKAGCTLVNCVWIESANQYAFMKLISWGCLIFKNNSQCLVWLCWPTTHCSSFVVVGHKPQTTGVLSQCVDTKLQVSARSVMVKWVQKKATRFFASSVESSESCYQQTRVRPFHGRFDKVT